MITVDPATLALPAAINGVRMLVSAFEGYDKGKFIKSDKAVCEEIRRRSKMLQDHFERVHAHSHKNGLKVLRDACDEIFVTIASMADDAQYSVTGSPRTVHIDVGKLSKKAQKKLVNHDLTTLNLLVEATRDANALLESLRTSGDEAGLNNMAGLVHDRIGRARNHFRERNMYIDGLVKR
ncbi:MAG: hypothetical protein HOE69_06215 [Euryarchaeota archaeon]|nr:hypothetical protein [Euryarchaeota archaeon]